MVAHGVVGGLVAEAGGGRFYQGFASGVFSKGLSGRIMRLSGGDSVAGTAMAAVVGGTASELAGGRFANGAVSSAFGYLFSELRGNSWKEFRKDTTKLTDGDGTVRYFSGGRYYTEEDYFTINRMVYDLEHPRYRPDGYLVEWQGKIRPIDWRLRHEIRESATQPLSQRDRLNIGLAVFSLLRQGALIGAG